MQSCLLSLLRLASQKKQFVITFWVQLSCAGLCNLIFVSCCLSYHRTISKQILLSQNQSLWKQKQFLSRSKVETNSAGMLWSMWPANCPYLFQIQLCWLYYLMLNGGSLLCNFLFASLLWVAVALTSAESWTAFTRFALPFGRAEYLLCGLSRFFVCFGSLVLRRRALLKTSLFTSFVLIIYCLSKHFTSLMNRHCSYLDCPTTSLGHYLLLFACFQNSVLIRNSCFLFLH